MVAWIGGFTAIFAATMGLVNNDIKRVLAYSTVSQLGYMMLALGVGSLAAGMFHLFTHAFFKALLFLCAGSVIHAVDTNDIREMGGLRKVMPWTWATMAIGALSLAGFPLFAGFWSKDEILAVTAASGNTVLLAFAVITVFLTAFYTFRMFFLTFHGQPRERRTGDVHAHPHEADWWMRGPLVILAVPAVVVGLLGRATAVGTGGFQHFLEGAEFHAVEPNWTLAAVAAGLAMVGIVVAWVMYGARSYAAEPLARLGGVYTLLMAATTSTSCTCGSSTSSPSAWRSRVALFDRQALDGLVNGVARLVARTGGGLRGMQTGRVQNYGLVLFGGMAVIALIFVAARPLMNP